MVKLNLVYKEPFPFNFVNSSTPPPFPIISTPPPYLVLANDSIPRLLGPHLPVYSGPKITLMHNSRRLL